MHEEKQQDSFTVKINNDERKLLDECKYILQQEKDSTSLKQLAWIGAEVVRDKKTTAVLAVVLNNYRRNKRMGIVTFD